MKPQLPLAALVSLVLAACGGGIGLDTTTTTGATPTTPGTTVVTSPPTSAVVTVPRSTTPLVVWVEDSALESAIRTRGEAYTAATGVAVEVRTYQPSGDGDSLLAALLAGSVEGAADIYVGPHTWLDPLAEAGLAEPIPVDPDLGDSIERSVAPRGHALAAPLAVDGVVQARNRALMPDKPAAVEEIPCPDADRCLLLPADGDADLHYPFLVAAGGYLFGPHPDLGYERDDVGVASDAAIGGVNVFAELLAVDTVDPVADAATAVTEFAAGSAALVWVRASGLAGVRASGMDVAIETLPTIAGNPAITSFRVLAAFVNPFGAAKSEAVEFTAGWLADTAGSGAVALATGWAPVWPEVADSAAGVVLESVATGHPVPPVADIDRIWFELSDAFRRIHTGTSVTDAMFGAFDDIGRG